MQQLSSQEKGGRLDIQAILNDGVIVNIELPKFRRAHPDMEEKVNQWLAFIDDYNKEAIKLAEKNNKTLERARVEMNYLTGDAAVRRLAELREKWDMDRNSDIYWAKKDGKEEAIKEIVKRLLKENMDIETIIRITQLSKEEIEKIKEETN